jgi:arsenate reductase-like glutaredoxin family protein
MTVEVYGSDMCGACQATEDFMEENDIEFEHKDILKNPDDAEDMADAIEDCNAEVQCEITPEKKPAIPIINTGDKLIIGFDKEEIKSLA